jgi:hypothetical protein
MIHSSNPVSATRPITSSSTLCKYLLTEPNMSHVPGMDKTYSQSGNYYKPAGPVIWISEALQTYRHRYTTLNRAICSNAIPHGDGHSANRRGRR